MTAEAPLLDTDSASAGQTIDNQDLMNLPVFSHTPLLLLKLAPGVQSTGERVYLSPNSLGRAAGRTVAGGIGGGGYASMLPSARAPASALW